MFKEFVLNKVKPWWNSKIAFLFSIAYFKFLIIDFPFNKSFYFIIIFLLSAVFTAVFAHILNDWFDSKEDGLVFKFNIINKIGKKTSLILLLISLTFVFLPWLFYTDNKYVFYLLSFEILLFFCYSFKYIRFKERKLLGVITDSLYAYVVFTGIILSIGLTYPMTTTLLESVLYIIVLTWVFLIGIQHIIIHQFYDYENDLKTHTKTWVIAVGKQNARKILFYYIFPLQLLLFILNAISVSYLLNNYLLILPILFLVLRIINVLFIKKYSGYVNSTIDKDLEFTDIKYVQFLSYFLLALLIHENNLFLYLLIFHVILFDFKFIRFIYIRFLIPIKKPISFIINYTIYYFRRFILFETQEKAMREHYESFLILKRQADIERKYPNIALLNINENKYTETFVLNHAVSLRNEGFSIHELFGFPIPDNSKQNGILYSNNLLKTYFLKFWNEFLFRESLYHEKKQFKRYLVKHNIELVLIEFGTCAVETYEICKELNIPIIVFFHGYDIHHKSILEENKEKYKGLFLYASLLVGVSKEIVLKLENLGADRIKIFYLPCALNFDLFTHSYSPKNNSTFLSVGRFTETKSPHLVILAFNEVLKKIPEAELRMIGKDGGGELFEACHILVRAFGIEKKVIFLGILSPQEVQQEMSKATVFVQHSLTTPIHSDKEGTPVSVMEAMATGMPIISTKHAGILDLIESEENGILVDEYDYLEMSKQMIRVAQDQELRNYLGRNAASSIRNNELIVNNSTILASLVKKYKLN